MGRTAKVISFSASPEFAAELERLASTQDRTRSELIREAVRHYRDSLGSSSVAREVAGVYATASPGALPGMARVLSKREEIRGICERYDVRRLWLFGSAVRDDFVPGRSDFDFQVEFREGVDRGPWLAEIFELKVALERVLGGEVDVSECGAVRNLLVANAIEEERVLIHESC